MNDIELLNLQIAILNKIKLNLNNIKNRNNKSVVERTMGLTDALIYSITGDEADITVEES